MLAQRALQCRPILDDPRADRPRRQGDRHRLAERLGVEGAEDAVHRERHDQTGLPRVQPHPQRGVRAAKPIQPAGAREIDVAIAVGRREFEQRRHRDLGHREASRPSSHQRRFRRVTAGLVARSGEAAPGLSSMPRRPP
ncbi:MAG: hypothetical protein IPF99_18915 [Deltaproteobacteria bacterium]|nr:hypothetical protein [Deltaproteobacteria bacterium]